MSQGTKPGEAGTILIVAYHYPPRPLSASVRPSAMARNLRRLDYRVNVITSGLWGRIPDEGPGRVVRTRDLIASPLNRRRSNVDRFLKVGGVPYDDEKHWLNRLLVPDLAMLTWTPFALAAAARMARSERIDCVITTSGPESAHLVGRRLQAMGVTWVADLRDGWRFEPYRGWGRPSQERLDAWLEGRLLPAADRVVTVSEPFTQDIRRRFGVPATTIPNGYDPDESLSAAPGSQAGLDPARCSLVHTGKLATAERPLEPLLDALRLVSERGVPGGARMLELVLAGPLSEHEAGLVDALAPTGLVRRVGVLARPDSLRLQADADALLVATAGTRTGEVTSKVFEYLRARRPILVLGEGTEAARIVRRTRSGIVAPVDDVAAIAAALEAMATGAHGYDPAEAADERGEYAYPRLAERMAGVVEEARAAGQATSSRPIRQASPR